MVGTEHLYQVITELSRKERNAYVGTTAFNRVQRLVQDALFDYYLKDYHLDRKIADALNPFLVSEKLPVVDQSFDAASTERTILSIAGVVVKNVPGGEPVVSEHPAKFLAPHEELTTVTSSVRRPDIGCKRFYWAKRGTSYYFYPAGVTSVRASYLRQPLDAFRGITIDTANVVENPDPASTIDFEWDSDQEGPLVELFLFYLGLQTKESSLIQWVQAKKQIAQ